MDENELVGVFIDPYFFFCDKVNFENVEKQAQGSKILKVGTNENGLGCGRWPKLGIYVRLW